jgi:hypothetical protein
MAMLRQERASLTSKSPTKLRGTPAKSDFDLPRQLLEKNAFRALRPL